MYGIAVQTKAHKDGFALQFLFEKGNNGDAASATLRYGGLAKGGFVCF